MNPTPIQILDNLMMAVSLLFLVNAVALYAIQTQLSIRTLRYNIGLCSTGFVYCFLLGLTQFDPSVQVVRFAQHWVWVSGVFYIYFLVTAIDRFLNTGSAAIRWCLRVIQGVSIITLALTLWYMATGKMILYSEGTFPTESVFFTETVKHSLTVNPLTITLGMATFVAEITAMVILLRRMIAQKQDRILIATTSLGLLAVLYELCLALHPFKYGPSVLFLAGLLESFRLAYLSIRNAIREQNALREQIDLERRKSIQNSKLASLGEMSAGIAHEINNPLTIIHGNMILIEKQAGDPVKIKQRVEAVNKSVERISKIVNGLRKFARSSRTEPYKPKCLSDIVGECILLTRNKALRHQVRVTFKRISSSPVLCNEIEIEQVLINLINNAIDAVKDLDERWVRIELCDHGEETSIRIVDSGPGVPKEIEDKIFDPFFTTKPQGEGMGLGLSISKGILDEHQAKLLILRDQPHTCFEIRFQNAAQNIVS